MRKLHLVGLTTDRDGLIFTARKGSKSGGYIVPLDEAVLAAVAETQAERTGVTAPGEGDLGDLDVVPRRPRHQSALTPREMQARLRAGRSIEEVAAEAGVDNDWVARFAVPILAEQAQVVELARTLVYAKPRLGESSQPLGPSVMLNLVDRGVFLPDDVADAGWSAFQLHDAVWMVRFRYRSRGRAQEAQWEVDVPAGRLQARNRHASDLGYVEAGRRHKVVAAEEDPAEDGAAVPRRRARAAPRRKAATATKARRLPAKTVARATPAKRAVTAGKATAGTTKAGNAAGTARTAGRAPGTAGKSAGGATKANGTGKVTGTATKAGEARKAARKVTGRATKAGKAAVATGPAAGRATPPTTTRRATATGRATKAGEAGKAGKATGTGAGNATAGKRAAAASAATPEPAPSTGPGGVRSAVAQVSTARVSASMASAERAPWAAAVRRPTGARVSPANGRESWERERQRPVSPADEAKPGPAFEPRPLPSGERATPAPAPRVRKVSTAKAVAPSTNGPKPVSLPAPRQPAPRSEPIPVERAKRRRLRSR